MSLLSVALISRTAIARMVTSVPDVAIEANKALHRAAEKLEYITYKGKTFSCNSEIKDMGSHTPLQDSK
jgi:hypothetical protein